VQIKEYKCFQFRKSFAHEFLIVGDALSVDDMISQAGHVSEMLSAADIPHELEIYDRNRNLVTEFSYQKS
jgi:hypothetical protein